MHLECRTTFWPQKVCCLICVQKGQNKDKNLGRLNSIRKLGVYSPNTRSKIPGHKVVGRISVVSAVRRSY